MSRSAVELHVAGQSYRVVTSAAEAELRHLAGVVEAKLHEVTAPGRQVAPQGLLLAAIALAHELELERARRQELEARTRDLLGRMLTRIDGALEAADQPDPEPDPEPELTLDV